jgi:hypothetical protein
MRCGIRVEGTYQDPHGGFAFYRLPPPKCPISLTSFDVNRSSLIATVNAAVGGKPNRFTSTRKSAPQRALDQPLRKRPISSKNRSQAGSCSRNKWFRPGKAMK